MQVVDVNRKFINGFLSLIFSILGFLTLSILIARFAKFDIAQALELAKTISIHPISEFRPEPLEQTIYLFGWVFFSITIFLLTKYFSKILKNLSNDKIRVLLNCVQWIFFVLVLIVGYLIVGKIIDTMTIKFYSGMFNPYVLLGYSLFVFPFIIQYFMYSKNLDSINKYLVKSMSIYSISLIILTFFMNIFSAYSVSGDLDPYSYHVEAVIYSMQQIKNGFPILIDGFHNTYGLYAHILQPLFKIFPFNLFSFSVVMSLLIVFSFVLLNKSMKEIIKNKLILFFGFTSFFYFAYLRYRIRIHDFYFQYHPIRFLFPVLVLYLVIKYLQLQREDNGKSKLGFYVISLIASIGILWNPESGVATFGAWVLFLAFKEFIFQSKVNYLKKVLAIFLKLFLILAVVFVVYSVGIYLFFGAFPNVLTLFTSVNIFAKVGYKMVPTVILHPWMLVIITYLIGICYSFLVESDEYQFDGLIILYLSFLGLGLFVYFLGRNRDVNLLHACWPAIVLLSIFADKLLNVIRLDKNIFDFKKILFTLIIFILGISFIIMVFQLKEIKWHFKHVNKLDNVFINKQKNDFILNVEFIKLHTKKHEKVLILSEMQGLYHVETRTFSPFNPGIIDLLYRRDFDKMIKFIINNQEIKIFYDTTRMSEYFDSLLQELYFVSSVSENGKMKLFKKRI
ncbi:hypothetical protein ACFL4A_00525 [bacterium]